MANNTYQNSTPNRSHAIVASKNTLLVRTGTSGQSHTAGALTPVHKFELLRMQERELECECEMAMVDVLGVSNGGKRNECS